MNKNIEEFKKRIKQKKVKIAVVGLGYVGLPLAIEFAKKNFPVLGIELDNDRLGHIKKKKSYISDVATEDLKKVILAGKFSASADFRPLKNIDIIIICVPTPLKRKYHPNISYIKQAVRAIARHIKKGSLVILESTTYPGTTHEVILPLFEKQNLKANKDFYLAFSPERIDPGNERYPVNKIPKVVGGVSKESTDLAVAVYSNIIDKVVPVSSATVAEATKLLENTFRLINIGLIDEIAMMCHKMNIDIWEVIEAAKTKPFGFMPFYPSSGCGGHCIPKDPLYLYWKAKKFGFKSRFIKLASDITNYMPEYVIERVIDLLKHNTQYKIQNTKILIIGVTYKKDIKDLRKSPPLDIIEILQKRKINVAYHDPLIPYLKIGNINLKSVALNAGTLKKFDCAIIATDHSKVPYNFLRKNAKLIFDTRNVYKKIKDKKITRL
ncbi:MAG: UDP-N-acetyl-D-glucosamine dehydrogenase [Omnitrophica WOR_2 bacterium RBG_13_41_10]|nr:MAG: UDP-N-acetyl-D-glucosamine dehydrogenase [Omnitrophica WOR_2 bacterium RBG_13_41_10]